MTSQRQRKKYHTRLLGEFLIDSSRDEKWLQKLKDLTIEGKLDTNIDGYPAAFERDFEEVHQYALHYCIERVDLSDIPRQASCWWPTEEQCHYYMAYPADFPRSAIFLAMDFEN